MAQNKAVQFTSPAQLRPCCTGLPGKDETKGSTGPSETAAEKVDTDIVGINLGGIMWNQCTYHLVMTNIAMENQHAINR